jgi:hypothetical protein
VATLLTASLVAAGLVGALPAGAQDDTTTTTTTTASTSTTLPGPAAPTTTTTSTPGSPTTPGGSTTTTTIEPGDTGSHPGDDAVTTTTSPDRALQLVPPPLDLTAISELSAVRRGDAVAAARAVADLANLAAGQELARATASLEAATARLAEADAALESARGAARAATATAEAARKRITDLAVESYQLAMGADPAVFVTPTDILRGSEGWQDYNRARSFSEAAAESLDRQQRSAEDAASAAAEAVEAAEATREQLGAAAEAARRARDDRQDLAEAVAADGARRIEDAEATGEALVDPTRGPAILGASVVPARYMADFVRARGRPHPSIDVDALAATYIAEGEAEGVQGDIAFTQSILETGWFNFGGSMVEVADHNYAGIGACDSCSSGFAYPTPAEGVRAQIQLLRTYAQRDLRTDMLANPPAGRAPERVGVRGCCQTWMALTGVWATAPNYGVRILQLYNEMLVFAAGRQRADVAALAAAQAPPPATPQP